MPLRLKIFINVLSSDRIAIIGASGSGKSNQIMLRNVNRLKVLRVMPPARLGERQSVMGETPYSPSPKGDATRTGILRQALASPNVRRPHWLTNDKGQPLPVSFNCANLLTPEQYYQELLECHDICYLRPM
ncbi:MAG: hypothetical protein HWQ35_22345 [Nostoc sp. NMS1]|uniref:hypothetical protein n=1 Tax=uncultured Nostoc sp. TaxID=340711 RepID=UPI0035CC040D|nr:hypothetical protein [Nostoc sp. NMS1]MBN3990358.1 hypothetical protein [Nostoc sp. NMS2]